MDFSIYDGLRKDEGIPVTLSDPFGKTHIGTDDNPVKLFLLPPGCPAYRAHIDATLEEKRLLQEVGELTREKRDELADRQIAGLIAGWTDNWTLHGEALSFSTPNALRLVQAAPPVKELLLSWGLNSGNAYAALQSAQRSGRNGEAVSTE